MTDYSYLKELEVSSEGDSYVLPIGHYNISTWSSEESAQEHTFKVTLEDTTKIRRGVMNITCVSQSSGCCMIAIPLNYSKPCSTYKVLHDDGIFEIMNYSTASGNSAPSVYKIKCKNACMCNVSIHQGTSCKIETSTDSATTNIQKCEQYLVEGVDYGTSLPAAGKKGRIFFVKV